MGIGVFDWDVPEGRCQFDAMGNLPTERESWSFRPCSSHEI